MRLTPMYLGSSACAVIAATLGLLNALARERDWILTPRCKAVESMGTTLLVLTVPLVLAGLIWTSKRFHAPRAVKRRYVVRQVVTHAVIAAIAVHIVRWSQPLQGAFVMSATREDGCVVDLHRWSWGCGYRLSRESTMGTARLVTAVGPFECDAPDARVEWRGSEVALVLATGETVGTWAAE